MKRCILGADVPMYDDSATVLSVQKALKARGFDPGVLDGVMGPNTGKAITAFQFANGLPPTGAIDSAVLVSLAIPPMPSKSKAPAVALIVPTGDSMQATEKPGFFMQPIPVPGLGDRPLWQVLLGVKGVMMIAGGVLWLALRKKRK